MHGFYDISLIVTLTIIWDLLMSIYDDFNTVTCVCACPLTISNAAETEKTQLPERN